MTALERAARAAFDSDWPDCGPDDPEWIASKDTYVNNARAVLMAVRDGSPEVFAAMEVAQPKWPSSQCDNARELAASYNDPKLRAAIDAILNEKDTTND